MKIYRPIVAISLFIVFCAVFMKTFADPFDKVIDWDGRLDIEDDLNDLGIQIEEGFVEFDFNEHHRLRLGNMKEEFGTEEPMGSDDIYSVNRSLVNRYIESFGILEHDISLHWRIEWEQSSQRHLQLYTVGGADASNRIFLNNASELKRVWGNIIMSNTLAYYREQFYDIVNIRYWTNWSESHFQCELFAGQDPNMTVINRELGIDRNAWFAAARVLYAHTFTVNGAKLTGLQPMFMAAFIMPEIDTNDDFLIQLLTGINVLFNEDGDVRWMTDLELVLSNNPQNAKIGRLSHGIYTQIQVSW